MATPIDPGNVQDFDLPLNTTPAYSFTYTFSTDDIVGTFEGLRQGDVIPGETPVIDFTATPTVTKEGVELYPINSEFGFLVTDFGGAVEKDFVDNPEYTEGWAGDLIDGTGAQIGLVISDAPTDTFKTPALLGTWLAGLGGNTVKASTEHYTVMQNVLSDQRYPGDPEADYPLDDNLRMVGGEYDGQYIADILPEIGDVNGDGAVDIKDVLQPNESTIAENIAVSDDYSVTLKDDGKLLYRWGNTVKRPNDVRIEAELELPDEWKEPDPASANPDLNPLFRVTQAELVVHHTITNNPNDQIRPEDYENESAIGTLPTYEVLPDGKWVSTDDYYAGDGTLYPAGTVLKDPALADAVIGSTLEQIGALSADLSEGFTNAWYTTMDREPFEPVLNDTGTDYETGPRWRLQPDKYGQDLPSVVIPLNPGDEPPPTKDEVKYEVGSETQTVINLLDWENPVSPLAISAGWLNGAGLTTENGVTLSDNFDLALYVKGDIKPATLYSAELVMDYEEVIIFNAGITINGGSADDFLVGQGNNAFMGGGGEDLFVLSYGAPDSASIMSSSISDFEAGVDTIGLIDLEVNSYTFDYAVAQSLVGTTLSITLNGFEIASLTGQTEVLGEENFLVLNAHFGGIPSDAIIGTENDDVLIGDDTPNTIFGLGGNDEISGLAENDNLYGDAGLDTISGGMGNDSIFGGAGEDMLEGDAGLDTIRGGLGDDSLIGGADADDLDGGAGFDGAYYYTSAVGVDVDLDRAVQIGGDAQGDTLIGIEEVGGSFFDDTLTGNDEGNILCGLMGVDTVFGGLGDDHVIGGAGADVIDGGGGVDGSYYYTSAVGVDVDLDRAVQISGDAQGDMLTSIELIGGSFFGDMLKGNAEDNTIYGLFGADVLAGLGGNDTLNGGAGVDTADYTGSNVGDFAIVNVDVSIWTITETASGDVDTLTDMEVLRFDDGDFMLTA